MGEVFVVIDRIRDYSLNLPKSWVELFIVGVYTSRKSAERRVLELMAEHYPLRLGRPSIIEVELNRDIKEFFGRFVNDRP